MPGVTRVSRFVVAKGRPQQCFWEAPPHPRVVPLNLWFGAHPGLFSSGSLKTSARDGALLSSGLLCWLVCNLPESSAQGEEAALPTTNRLTVDFYTLSKIWLPENIHASCLQKERWAYHSFYLLTMAHWTWGQKSPDFQIGQFKILVLVLRK